MFIAFLAAAVAPTSAVSPAKPIAEGSWFSGSDYPAEAAKNGVEGSVTFEVDVDSTGKPTACRIAKSSGSELLDQTTCRIVIAKGKFLPAMVNGKPVPDTIQKVTVWRLQNLNLTALGSYAVILDFSKDADHPTCSLLRNGLAVGPTCEQALQNFGQLGVRARLTKLVALRSVTRGDQQPYHGQTDWGRRAAFSAIEIYPPKDPKSGAKPACAVLAQQNAPPGLKLCGAYAEESTVSDADKNNPNRLHIEESLFAVQRQDTPTAGKCKDGESAAETQSCI